MDDDNESVALGFGTMPEEGVTAGSPNQATVAITDDDTSGIVFNPTRLTVTEEDATGSNYTVKLRSRPTANVTVTISGHSGTTLSLSGSTLNGNALTFTTDNWNTTQTVTVKAAHDDNAVNELLSLTHTASGGGYNNVSNGLPVTINDDDPAVTVKFGQASYNVDEGSSVDVTVTLSADPERTVGHTHHRHGPRAGSPPPTTAESPAPWSSTPAIHRRPSPSPPLRTRWTMTTRAWRWASDDAGGGGHRRGPRTRPRSP